ncbi:MAG TPA: Clp protease N-terminal domain-containing protein, partial [Aggregicoccus sp.]|nr:Clp protease N-terminal domain-containing protein [Aggregicoccus sp.]
MVDGTDLAQVLHEAEDIANSVAQKLTSAHVLLALFTVENPAQLLLKERGVDEDGLLQTMSAPPDEAPGLVRELRERAREIARNCGSAETECLHLLIAVTRVRCAAAELLTEAGLDLSSLRNTALSYFLSGRMPRKLQVGRSSGVGMRPVPTRPLGAPPSPLPAAPLPSSYGAAVAVSVARPAISPRDLIDEVVEEVEEAHAEQERALAPQRAPAPLPAPAARTAPLPPPPERAEGFELDPKLFPTLTSLGRNLSIAARAGELDPVVGRAKEIEEVIDILGKRRTNNPCLLG